MSGAIRQSLMLNQEQLDELATVFQGVSESSIFKYSFWNIFVANQNRNAAEMVKL